MTEGWRKTTGTKLFSCVDAADIEWEFHFFPLIWFEAVQTYDKRIFVLLMRTQRVMIHFPFST